MIQDYILQHYRTRAQFGDLMKPHTTIELLDEIERLQKEYDRALKMSMDMVAQGDKENERYRKALEDIAYDTELNITDSYQMVLHARKAIKGDETV